VRDVRLVNAPRIYAAGVVGAIDVVVTEQVVGDVLTAFVSVAGVYSAAVNVFTGAIVGFVAAGAADAVVLGAGDAVVALRGVAAVDRLDVAIGVAVGIAIGVAVGIAIGVAVGIAVGVAVAVRVAVRVAIGVAITIAACGIVDPSAMLIEQTSGAKDRE
jgi:hypothetical protein